MTKPLFWFSHFLSNLFEGLFNRFIVQKPEQVQVALFMLLRQHGQSHYAHPAPPDAADRNNTATALCLLTSPPA